MVHLRGPMAVVNWMRGESSECAVTRHAIFKGQPFFPRRINRATDAGTGQHNDAASGAGDCGDAITGADRDGPPGELCFDRAPSCARSRLLQTIPGSNEIGGALILIGSARSGRDPEGVLDDRPTLVVWRQTPLARASASVKHRQLCAGPPATLSCLPRIGAGRALLS